MKEYGKKVHPRKAAAQKRILGLQSNLLRFLEHRQLENLGEALPKVYTKQLRVTFKGSMNYSDLMEEKIPVENTHSGCNVI